MNNTNSFLIQNKIVTIDQIKEITEYLKKTLNHYNDLINQELQENNNASFYSGHYKHYAYNKPSLEYKIEYIDGRKIDTKDESLFYDALKEPQYVYKIDERLYISYDDNDMGETTNHLLDISLAYSESVIHFVTSNKNMNDELYNLNSYINGILNSGEDRFNKTIQNRFWIKNIIGLSAGSIFTLLGFFILLIIKNESTEMVNMLFNNPIILVLCGWLIAFAFGITIILPVISKLYVSLEVGLENAYKGGTFIEHYEDNYRMFNEVLIGKNYNNLKKRETIRKIYDISKKVLLIRLVISLIILLVLSLI